ncbi:MAG: hypothetical protein K8R45_14290 [Desulfobacterales bacterium]|nr:hypothetical protein [Desulfobacterales bacterium]
MNYFIRITIEMLIAIIFLGIPHLISFPVPKLKGVLEEYRKNKSHKSCFVISGISSIVLVICIVIIIKLKSGSFLEPQDIISIFIPVIAIGYIGLIYSSRKFG